MRGRPAIGMLLAESLKSMYRIQLVNKYFK
jgi:hypothetical protein